MCFGCEISLELKNIPFGALSDCCGGLMKNNKEHENISNAYIFMLLVIFVALQKYVLRLVLFFDDAQKLGELTVQATLQCLVFERAIFIKGLIGLCK